MGDSESGIGVGTGSKFYQFGAGVRIEINFLIILTLVRVPKNNHVKGFLGLVLTPKRVLVSFLTPADALKSLGLFFSALCSFGVKIDPQEPLLRFKWSQNQSWSPLSVELESKLLELAHHQ